MTVERLSHGLPWVVTDTTMSEVYNQDGPNKLKITRQSITHLYLAVSGIDIKWVISGQKKDRKFSQKAIYDIGFSCHAY